MMPTFLRKAYRFKAQYGVAVAFAALAFAGGWAINEQANQGRETLYEAQLAACDRGNVLREEVNDRGAVLRTFLMTAADSREAAAVEFRKDGEILQAKTNERAARLWDGLVHDMSELEIIDCKLAIQKP